MSTPSAADGGRCASPARRIRRVRTRARKCLPADRHAPGAWPVLQSAGIRSSFARSCLQHSSADLVGFDRFEERLEIPLAESLVALPLDDLEEDRADRVLRENLQEQTLILRRRAVEQDAVALETFDILSVAFYAVVDTLVVRVRGILEGNAMGAQVLDRVEYRLGRERDVLDAFAAVQMQIFLDLRFVVGRLVDGNADLAARARHRARLEPRQLALDVEVADLAEIEELLVEAGPAVEVAAEHVVRDVIDHGEPRSLVVPALGGIGRYKVHVVDGVRAVTVNEIDDAAADALDGRNVELHRSDLVPERCRAKLDRAFVCLCRIPDAESHGAGGGTVFAGEAGAVAVGFGVDDKIDAALAVEGDALGAVPRHRTEIHPLEQRVQFARIGRGVFDEFESVGAQRIVPQLHARSSHHPFTNRELVSNETISPSRSFTWRRQGERQTARSQRRQGAEFHRGGAESTQRNELRAVLRVLRVSVVFFPPGVFAVPLLPAPRGDTIASQALARVACHGAMCIQLHEWTWLHVEGGRG